MGETLFRLNGVSDDETNDARELLINNAIDFAETSFSNQRCINAGRVGQSWR